MTLSKPSPSDAELWRRLVWWAHASDWMIGGCLGGCALAVVASVILIALGAQAAYVCAVGAALLGGVMEGIRRLCDARLNRALDAAAPRLLASHGLSREAALQAAAALRSGRIEELDASLAFESDPFHCAIESVLGRPGASLSPLCEQGEGAHTVVVALGTRWAGVLRFTNGDLREALARERRFAWNDGAGPRRLDLPIDADARALLERSIGALATSSDAFDPPDLSDRPHLLDDGGLAFGLVVVDGAGGRRGAIGKVDVARSGRVHMGGGGGGPYRSPSRPAEPTRSEEAVVELEGRRHTLAATPHDESPESIFAHVILCSAARVLRPLVLAEQYMAVKGRPLRVDGVSRVAGVRPGSEWIDAVAPCPEVDHARRARLSDLWLRAALEEHASIFAFERLARVLSTLGAPLALVDRTLSAMREETLHARDGFSLAAAYGGEQVGPGPLLVPDGPLPSVDALAIETFFDGCIGETLAARQASVALARCRVPAARAAIERVAIDERGHAELAWDTLEWLLPRTSAEARATISEASFPPSATMGASERDRRDGEWLAWHGWLTSAEETAIAIEAWTDEIGPRRDGVLAANQRCNARGSLTEAHATRRMGLKYISEIDRDLECFRRRHYTCLAEPSRGAASVLHIEKARP